MIQIITTHEAMEEVFSHLIEKAFFNYQPIAENQQHRIVTGEDLAKTLGVTIQTLIKWRQKGKIPFIPIGSAIRYDLNAVIKALEVGIKKGVKS